MGGFLAALGLILCSQMTNVLQICLTVGFVTGKQFDVLVFYRRLVSKLSVFQLKSNFQMSEQKFGIFRKVKFFLFLPRPGFGYATKICL